MQILHIIKIIYYYTNRFNRGILSSIFQEARNIVCLKMINLLIEKYGKFNAINENEGENLFKVLENEGNKLLFLGSKY